ncbi:MAG: ferric iron uptake transcriptional regulator [Legionellales bacterium]|nr:ferric iron uptake transcriptional regulator [Legionellales bacterium]|tara:strand:- start:57 stop:479 length:423 start_codon:yes stop_codon:yes gene_type:complete
MNNADLRKAGLKVTSPRVKILDILEEAGEGQHLSAEDIYGQLKQLNQDVGLATVYRVLTQFEAADLVTKHNFEGGYSVYELNQGEHHDHLVCVKCGKVVEFVDDLIESRQEQIAKEAGFEITDHSLNIYGICPACKTKAT